MDFVSGPGVSVTAACFSDGVYDYQRSLQCLSNLMAMGFDRLVFDVYWDSRRLAWSLCPAEIPTSYSGSQNTTLLPAPSSTAARLSTAQLTGTANSGRHLKAPRQTPSSVDVKERQDTGTGSSSMVASTAATTPSTATPISSSYTITSTQTTAAIGSNAPFVDTIYTLGPLRCSQEVDLPFLIGFLSAYLDDTDNTLEAFLKIVTLNVHAAASYLTPTEPAAQPPDSDLPAYSNQLGPAFYANLSSYMFTPSQLDLQRGDPDQYWDQYPEEFEPDSAYYDTVDINGQNETLNGWPSESLIEIRNNHRLLIGYGSFDPQMANYNKGNDESYVFAYSDLHNRIDVDISDTDKVTSGCLFNPSNISISAANNSWAFTSLDLNLDPVDAPSAGSPSRLAYGAVSNLTACGISSILNETLLNSTAAANITPYLDYVGATVWSWAPGQPENDTYAPANASSDPGNNFRCAAFNPFSSPQGRWQTAACANEYRAACRSVDQPHNWTITSRTHNYLTSGEDDICPDNTAFAVPRTPLENMYLLQAYQSADLSQQNDSLLWVNFNSRDIESCWVQGVNTTCPYKDSNSTVRQIVVPTVAAAIVIILAIFMVIVKCGANRVESRKRRRRVLDGWDYEGVPS